MVATSALVPVAGAIASPAGEISDTGSRRVILPRGKLGLPDTFYHADNSLAAIEANV